MSPTLVWSGVADAPQLPQAPQSTAMQSPARAQLRREYGGARNPPTGEDRSSSSLDRSAGSATPTFTLLAGVLTEAHSDGHMERNAILARPIVPDQQVLRMQLQMAAQTLHALFPVKERVALLRDVRQEVQGVRKGVLVMSAMLHHKDALLDNAWAATRAGQVFEAVLAATRSKAWEAWAPCPRDRLGSDLT